VLVRHVFDRDAQRRVLLDEGLVVATEGLDFGVEFVDAVWKLLVVWMAAGLLAAVQWLVVSGREQTSGQV